MESICSAATMLSFLHNYTILDVYLTTDFIQMITQLQNLQVISECQSHACHIKYFNYVNSKLEDYATTCLHNV